MTANFWDNEPTPVRAVLDFSAMRDGQDDPAHDRACDLFAGEHSETIRELAQILRWVERLGYDAPVAALTAYYGQWRGEYPDRAADVLAADLRNEATFSAQLIASVLRHPSSGPRLVRA